MLSRIGAISSREVASTVLVLATSLLAGCSSGSDEAAEGGRDPEAPTTTATDAGFVPGQPWVYDPELA